MKKQLILPRHIKDEILEHALAGLPHEACGIIAADQSGNPVRFYPTSNIYRRGDRYEVPPEELLEVFLDMEDKGYYLWGIFHTHPCSSAYPSPTDLEEAYYPEAYYFILSVQEPTEPCLRAFRIVDRQVEEFQVVVEVD